MNWKYETRRYLYCREEGSFAALSCEARMLAGYILKYTDDKGRIYARVGEDVVEALMFRMRASRGARRWMREAYDELVADGYLVVVSPTCVRVKNFLVAHAKPEAAPDLIVEASTNGVRIGDEPVATDSPSRNEPTTTAPRTSNEECVKSANSLKCDPALPSVPSGPSVPPSDPGSLPLTRDLTPPVLVRPEMSGAVSGVLVRETFARVFCEVIGGKLPWQVTAGSSMWTKSEAIARTLTGEDERFIEPTMRTILERARESQDPRDRDRSFAFGSWCSRFFDMRDEILGLRAAAPARASPGRSVAHGHARPDLAATETTGDMTGKL